MTGSPAVEGQHGGVDPAAAVEIAWLPLGAGGHVVRRCGRMYEALSARREGRAARDLYHAALVVVLDGVRTVVEQAPAWGSSAADRGVAVEGPVGLRWLGRWRAFRYELRRWPGGVIPDLDEAVESPVVVSSDPVVAARLLDLVPRSPALTWGRDELGLGQMWNSNAAVAWLLARAGADVDAVQPPHGGRAPGWGAGLELARRQRDAADPDDGADLGAGDGDVAGES